MGDKSMPTTSGLRMRVSDVHCPGSCSGADIQDPGGCLDGGIELFVVEGQAEGVVMHFHSFLLFLVVWEYVFAGVLGVECPSMLPLVVEYT